MKQLLRQSLQVLALLVALALPGFAEESNRGLYEGALAGGGRIVFFVQGNHSISGYVFDTAGKQATYGAGSIAADNTFSVTLLTNVAITGSVTPQAITAAFAGQNINAPRAKVFGESEHASGRFTGTARGSNGTTFEAKFLVDAQKNIFFVSNQAGVVNGGFGTITVTQSPTPTPSPKPSASPSPSATPTATPSPTPHTAGATSGGADDGGGHDGGDDRGGEHRDEVEDEHEDDSSPSFTGTFSLALVSGDAVSGTFRLAHGRFSATFTIAGVTYNFRGNRESSVNHLANISTRGFVNTGQGQLIGGFIITGGPKTVLVRAMGPSLTAAGVTPALANPKLQLLENGTALATSDDWQSNANAADISATGIAPSDAKESAILINLEPGAYTTVVSGADNGTGIALVEVYEIEHD